MKILRMVAALAIAGCADRAPEPRQPTRAEMAADKVAWDAAVAIKKANSEREAAGVKQAANKAKYDAITAKEEAELITCLERHVTRVASKSTEPANDVAQAVLVACQRNFEGIAQTFEQRFGQRSLEFEAELRRRAFQVTAASVTEFRADLAAARDARDGGKKFPE